MCSWKSFIWSWMKLVVYKWSHYFFNYYYHFTYDTSFWYISSKEAILNKNHRPTFITSKSNTIPMLNTHSALVSESFLLLLPCFMFHKKKPSLFSSIWIIIVSRLKTRWSFFGCFLLWLVNYSSLYFSFVYLNWN